MSPSPRLSLRAASLDATHAIAAALAGLSRAGDVILLAGEMGAGKTAFAQGFAAGLGVLDTVTSPTFTLVHTYEGCLRMHHADIYRLERTAEEWACHLGTIGYEIVCGIGPRVPRRLTGSVPAAVTARRQ